MNISFCAGNGTTNGWESPILDGREDIQIKSLDVCFIPKYSYQSHRLWNLPAHTFWGRSVSIKLIIDMIISPMSLVITVCLRLSRCNFNDTKKMEWGPILYVDTVKYVQMDYVPSHSEKHLEPLSKKWLKKLTLVLHWLQYKLVRNTNRSVSTGPKLSVQVVWMANSSA